MVIEKFPQVQTLAPEEKWMLIDELWHDLAEHLQASPVDAELVRQLEARLAEYSEEPSKGSLMDEVFARLAERKRAWEP